MNMLPHSDPHHAIINLEGGPEEVLHIKALGRNIGVKVQIDEAHTGLVITTRNGIYRQAIFLQEATHDG